MKHANAKVSIRPLPGQDAYIIEIVTIVDGFLFSQAKDKERLMQDIINNTIRRTLAREIVGQLALLQLTPEMQRAKVIAQWVRECQLSRRLIEIEDLKTYLKERGFDK